jgi:threonine/homoserine/homoserine lactone efflux protein
MSWEIVSALMAFAFISSWTPGPNNTILAVPNLYDWSVGAVVLAFTISGIGSAFTWTLFGTALRSLLNNPDGFAQSMWHWR